MYLRLALNLLHSHDDLEFRILQPPTPDVWDYKHVPPCLVYVTLECSQGFLHSRQGYSCPEKHILKN